MADTRFGNFQQLMQGKKPMTAKEAWIMLNELGLLAQEFVPGATSVRKLLEGKPIEALYDLQDWIPGNAAWQNFINGRDQDWVRNGLDAMAIANPLTKGVSKVMRAVEKVPKGAKDGFIQAVFLPKQGNKAILVKPQNQDELTQFNKAIDLAAEKGQIPKNDAIKMKVNAASDLKEQQYLQRGIDLGEIDPYYVGNTTEKLKAQDVDPAFINKYNTVTEVGKRHKVNEKPRATTELGNTYYTTGELGNQLLYSENKHDAARARHLFTDYNNKYRAAALDLVKSYPNPRDPSRYGYIKDLNGANRNSYKSVVEPVMLEGKVPYKTLEASTKSIYQGQKDLERNPLYMPPDDFLKYMLGLEP